MPRPEFLDAKTVERVRLGNYQVSIFDTVESTGKAKYAYIASVPKEGEYMPVFFVTSEVNPKGKKGGGSHVLCTFDETEHKNLGASDDWGAYDKFRARTLQLVKEKFNMKDEA